MLSNKFLKNLWVDFSPYFWPNLKEIKDHFENYVPEKIKSAAESVKTNRNLTHNLSKFLTFQNCHLIAKQLFLRVALSLIFKLFKICVSNLWRETVFSEC